MESEPISNRYRRGDSREDGKLFWAYIPRGKGGEYWVTKEKFDEYQASQRASIARYSQTDKGRAAIARHGESEKRKASRRRASARYRKTPHGQVAVIARRSAAAAAKYAGQDKPHSSFELLGTDLEGFKSHIEGQFLDGMNWDNYGEWEVDHRVPLASTKSLEDIRSLCYYKNLQPLWKGDNRSKGAKMPDDQ